MANFDAPTLSMACPSFILGACRCESWGRRSRGEGDDGRLAIRLEGPGRASPAAGAVWRRPGLAPGTNLGHERSAGSAPRRRVRASAVPLMAWLLQGRQSGPASPQQARYGWVWTRFGGEATPEETGRCKESVTTGLPSRGRPNRSASLLHMASRRRGAGPLTRPCNFGSKAYVPQPQTTQAATWREVSISLRCSFCLLMDP
jgi:hypothetical protein